MTPVEREYHAQTTIGMRYHAWGTGCLHSCRTRRGDKDTADERLITQLLRGCSDEVRCEVRNLGCRAGHESKPKREAISAKRKAPPHPAAGKSLTIPAMHRLTACLLALSASTSVLQAQDPQRRRILPELRADFVAGDVVSTQVAAGVHVNTGAYVRLAFLGGYGRAWDDDEQGPSYRLEAQGRFHLDPLRSTRFGLYGIGGVSANHDPFADWQTRLVLGAGVELPAYARATLAIEVALAGGLRFSVATRRVPLGRR